MRGKSDIEARKAEQATFYFGKYNLNLVNGEPGSITSSVIKLVVHPNWNHLDERYDSDIAIAVLLRTIEFSKFVKPICIWTETNSYSDLIGKDGFVVGWGKTETGATSSSAPMWTKLPIVDSLVCLRSNRDFSPLASDNNFCAGDLSGHTGPCNGDSDKFHIIADIIEIIDIVLTSCRRCIDGKE